MPAGTLLVSTPVVRLAEDVEDKIYNFRPKDTPVLSSIERDTVDAVLHEWTADTYRAPNAANAAAEGATATFSAPAQPLNYNNRTQIFQDTVSVSGTAEAVKKYGRKSELDRQRTKKMIECKKDQEAALISSPVAVQAVGATAGRLRGLYGWIATNDSLGAGGVSPDPINNVAPTAGTLRPFAEVDFNNIIQAVYEMGGDASVAIVSPSHKRRMSNAFTANGVQRTNEVGDATGKGTGVRLQASFTLYGHDFGVIKVVPNRVMTGAGAGLINTAYIIDYDKMKWGVLRGRGWQSSKMGKTGDSEEWQVLTECTLIVAQESTLGAIRDLTATGA